MAASIFESPLLAKRFPTGDAGRLFTDTAEVRALLLVAGSLAKAQGELGLIPEDSAFFIHRSAMEVQIDPAGLAKGLTSDAEVVAQLKDAFATAMEAPEHAQYILTDVDPLDIVRTARVLRLRQLLSLCEKSLAERSETEFKFQVAKLEKLRTTALILSFHQVGPVRTKLAEALRLNEPHAPWPTDEHPIIDVSAWLTETCAITAHLDGPRKDDRQALSAMTSALHQSLQLSPTNMTTYCLPQIALSTFSALILISPPVT